MAQCAYADQITSRRHLGPYRRCASCGNVICEECVAKNLANGKALCLMCVAQAYNPSPPPQPAQSYSPPNNWNRTRTKSLSDSISQVTDSIVHGISDLFVGLAVAMLAVLRFLGRPFGNNPQSSTAYDQNNRYRVEAELDLGWIRERQRVLFVALFVVVVFAAFLLGFLYAYYAYIPTYRFLAASTAMVVSWGIFALYLRFLFRNLGEPATSLFAYSAAFFLSLLVGYGLINLRFLDRLFSSMG